MSFLRRHWSAVVLVVATGIGVGRIVATYPRFYQTWDEPAHIAAGTEWLQRGSFRLEAMHPPLPRVATALGPYLAGLRLAGTTRPDSLGFYGGRRALFEQGNALLETGGRYQRNLTLARLGNLPFFIAACLLVWGWGRAVFGEAVGAAAVALFSTLPSILGHAGLATTDMALVATLTGALWACTRWLEDPSWRRTVIVGVAVGFALVSKMSAAGFVPVTFFGLAVLRHAVAPIARGMRWTWVKRAATVAAVAALVVWGTYRFSVGRIAGVDPQITQRIERRLGDGFAARTLAGAAALPLLPAPAYWEGVKDLLYFNMMGRKSYLLGRVLPRGSAAFFPVGILFKTPVPFLVLTAVGAFLLVRSVPSDKRWDRVAPLVAVAMMLALVLPARINIGSRHVLAAFPSLALVAGYGVVWLSTAPWRRRLGPVLAAGLLTWQVLIGVRTHPDYLSYFNALSPLAPQPILLDSDLDWGQDLKRLADTLPSLSVDTLWIAYHGSADLSRRLPVPVKELPPFTPVCGWVAISIYKLKMGLGSSVRSGHYAWLSRETAAAPVGSSMLLYDLPCSGNAP